MGQPATPKPKRAGTRSLDLIGIGPERDQFLENFSLLMSSGTGVLVALESLAKDARSAAMRRIIRRIRDDIDAGHPLSAALDASGMLSPQVISLIKIGEESGRLPENLKVVAVQAQKERLFQSKLISAMIYPALVFTITVLVGLMIAWFVLPKLSLVFGQLRIELPLITKVLIGIGQFLNHYGIVAVPAAAFLFLLSVYLLFVAKPTRWIGEDIVLAVPGLRRVVVEVELARFSYVMGTLLHAGLPVLETLQSIENATPFANYRRLYSHLRQHVEEGHTFKTSLETYPRVNLLIPVPIQQLINASEQSGTLADSFIRISDLYEEKTDITTKNLVVIIEPIMLVIVWLGVMFVAIAVVLPIYKLVGDFTNATETPAAAPPPAAAEETPQASALPAATAVGVALPADGVTRPTVLGARSDAPVAPRTVSVAADGLAFLNIRDRPSESGAVVAHAQPGSTYEVLDAEGGWYQVALPAGGTGWVSGQFVTVTQP